MTNPSNREDDLDWENRRLCIDGNCIGVIGPDGRCKECGKPFGNDLPPHIPQSSEAGEEAAETGPEPTPPTPEISDDEPAPVEIEDISQGSLDDEWENRQLCANGNCIGVIGPDGLCKECGRPAGEADDD